MAAVPEPIKPDSAWKTALASMQAKAIRAGRASRHFFLGRPWTWLRVLRWTVSALAALLVAAVLWLYFLDWNTMRGPLARYASARLGRTVSIDGKLDVRIFSLTPRVSASGVRIANPDWAGSPHAADIANLTFTFRLLPFLLGDTVLPLVRLDRPDILILRQADGRTNWDMGGGTTGWNLPPIQRFLVLGGHVRIDDRLRKLVFAGTVSSEENAGAGRAAFQLTGDGTLNGSKFTAQLRGGPLIHVDQGRPYAFTADVHAGATHVTADGAVAHPFHLGQFSAATTFEGPNLSELYDLTGLAMPHTTAYRIKGLLTRDGSLYRFSDFSGVVGTSDLSGNLAVDAAGAKPFVSGTVTSRVLDFKDLGALFGGKSAAAAASGRLLPDLPLHLDRLRQMDASVDYAAGAIRSQDFPLRGVHAHIDLRNAVLTVKPLAFQFAYGRLSGRLTIDAHGAVPVTSVDARVTDIGVEQFLGGDPPAATGLLEARAQLSGTGNSVQKVTASANGPVTLAVPRGAFNQKMAELTGIDLLNALLIGSRAQTNLRCAVAHFDTRDGAMRSPGFVFDTEPVRIEGKGVIDLKTETLDLTVVGKPKALRIGRVRSPIRITGALAHPSIDIEAGPVVLQGGVAAALGLIFPPAAILPFIDPGLAKDANCAELLMQATSHGAPVKTARRR